MFRADLKNRERAVRQLTMRLCSMHESLEYLGRIAAMTMRDGAVAPESERRTRWA